MVHMPVDLVWFQLVRRVVSNPNDPIVALVAVIGVILASLLAAGLLYTYIERPARAWLRANAPFKK
jgi:peptidoglycan/LPS O-acetylase OafA/YrhL